MPFKCYLLFRPHFLSSSFKISNLASTGLLNTPQEEIQRCSWCFHLLSQFPLLPMKISLVSKDSVFYPSLLVFPTQKAPPHSSFVLPVHSFLVLGLAVLSDNQWSVSACPTQLWTPRGHGPVIVNVYSLFLQHTTQVYSSESWDMSEASYMMPNSPKKKKLFQ